MSFVQNLIRHLFPHKTITHHISDLNQLLEQYNEKTDICISIENENKSRQFCCLTIEQLLRLFDSCPVPNRTLYECISSNKLVKAYIDFEYLIDKNRHIQNHYLGPISCLRILYYFLNPTDNTIKTIQRHTENLLMQFLVLDA